MFLARASRCGEVETVDCPKEPVWVVYSAVLNSTGGAELGFLRAFADGALSPVDVENTWYT